MCLIYDDEDHRRKIISQFLSSGISSHEKVDYFVDTMKIDDTRNWLTNLGVVLPDEKPGSQCRISIAEDIYCPNSRFIPSRMLDTLRACYTNAIRAGYSGARLSGEMSWALRGIPGSKRLMEYESLINTIVDEFPVTPICQYDARRFSGTDLYNVLKVHPMMIVEGRVVNNPYYVSSDVFLKTFKEPPLDL